MHSKSHDVDIQYASQCGTNKINNARTVSKIETSQCHAAEESGTALDEARATPAAFELLN